jgi:hypothetical protein
MVTIEYKGRLGNNMFQYISAYFFAKKFGLSLMTLPIHSDLHFGEFFNLNNCYGDIINSPSVIITDDNFLEYLKQTDIPKAHYIFCGYFQNKNFIMDYENEIIKYFRPINNKIDEVFVVYRIGDIIDTPKMLSIEYYRKCLNKITFNSGYITSDSPDHPNVIKLCEEFGLKLYHNSSPLTTIDFARKFNKLVLSEGTFSWWIGYLSQAEIIICNKRDYIWHGDIFLDRWEKMNFNN